MLEICFARSELLRDKSSTHHPMALLITIDMKKKWILFILSLVITFIMVQAQGDKTSHERKTESSLKRPGAGEHCTDPVFGNPITRITDSKKDNQQGTFPQYSKRQAWNADESLMILFSDERGGWLPKDHSL